MKRGNLYQNLRIEEQLKFKKLYYSNYMMGYRLPRYRRGSKVILENSLFKRRNKKIFKKNLKKNLQT